jgi:hypothetical protein
MSILVDSQLKRHALVRLVSLEYCNILDADASLNVVFRGVVLCTSIFEFVGLLPRIEALPGRSFCIHYSCSRKSK